MTNYRDSFYTEVQRGLIGTGSDIFGVPDSEELISDYPLNRYYSGILFPLKDFPKGNPISEEEVESSSNQAETDEEDYDSAEEKEQTGDAEEKEESNEEDYSQTSDTQDYQLIQNAFFPTHIGFTFCIEPKKFIGVNFSFGIYDQLEQPQSEIKIAISKEGFDSFFDETIENQLSFKDILTFKDGFMQLSRKLNGSRGGREKRSGEYLDFDNFRSYKNIGDKEAYKHIHLLEKLLGRIWKREHFSKTVEVKLNNSAEPIPLFNKEYGSQILSVCYMVKTYEYKGNNYVKILLLNNSSHPSNKYSNSNENLNRKCLFQTKVSVENISLKPYKSQSELHPFDEEQNEINFIYRDIKSYGVGHNCSVQWDDSPKPTSIQTTFIPDRIVYGMKNDFTKEDFPNDFDALNCCLEVKQLSHFNNDKRGIINSLNLFVSLYEKWIASQQETANSFQGEENRIANNLVGRQKENHKRLLKGIDILEKDKNGEFQCFQLANTAMFIQMIISNDRRFGNKERHLTDDVEIAEYNSLKFFEDYNDWTFINPDKPEPPRYRPFQLAFMLLSIEGIVDENSEDRKNLVDLIWFPTGGGKTEAYLSVAAFTILWRRLSKDSATSKGTSILMRYTLRLLTSQQFERASRLILALEFLRSNFKDKLHEEKISIGLWVGEGASPNQIQDANKIVEDATGNFEKADQYTSRLQLTACPWCGTKLVSRTAKGWTHGYDCQAGTQGYFYFKCVNNKCAFHASRLPIQVVDEMLYNQPPTLLFATVDKFAILASQKEGATHMFFNSFNDSLPPDLIIQDELHLISGPLGSIVGLFESVVDYLCSKGNRKPKIISSTATTRNTSHQISELYAGKQVNIFPPSGISYSDSFFAKETISKRKYVGFLPTGKTGINTQLWMLPYLLFTRIKLLNDNELNAFNLYWTAVSYYNSLKDVGKIYNKTNDEIQINTNVLFYRHFGNNSALRYLIRDIDSRSLELTSRIESNNIKATLKRLEDSFSTEASQKGNEYVKDGLDLVLASNMISVGIDVSRLNVMLVNGMPRNIAEYIQASSRVGRRHDGIVFTLFNPNQARDKSYFENFNSFHQAYYKFVEPLSVTPFTENTIRKMLTTIFVAFMRNSVSGLTKNSEAKHFAPEMADDFKTYITSRFGHSDYLNALLDDLIKSWTMKKNRINNLTYTNLLKRTSDDVNPFEEIWLTMNSLRDIDTETYYRINDLQTN